MRYLKYALKGLQFQNVRQLLLSSEMELCAWNILIHNLRLANTDYLNKNVIPILKAFTATQFQTLFQGSGLRNISTLFWHFNSNDGVFQWQLPKGIQYHEIDFLKMLDNSSLADISHFLFNFYFIGRNDYSAYFAELLQKHPGKINQLLEIADLKSFEFFIWNLWMALPAGKKPVLQNEDSTLALISEKIEKQLDDHESILSLAGVLYFLEWKLPELILKRISYEKATKLCQKAAKDRKIKVIRMLGGLSAIDEKCLTKSDKELYMNTLNDLTLLTIPNGLYVIKRLKKWLHD
ncbi:MAG: hypothetical protein GY749_14065 [Desulfobacteraceae bacterium]|nr:hypothetical protein [Desulfobacteraceae bacterium]